MTESCSCESKPCSVLVLRYVHGAPTDDCVTDTGRLLCERSFQISLSLIAHRGHALGEDEVDGLADSRVCIWRIEAYLVARRGGDLRAQASSIISLGTKVYARLRGPGGRTQTMLELLVSSTCGFAIVRTWRARARTSAGSAERTRAVNVRIVGGLTGRKDTAREQGPLFVFMCAPQITDEAPDGRAGRRFVCVARRNQGASRSWARRR
jgi:hypothetical protein